MTNIHPSVDFYMAIIGSINWENAIQSLAQSFFGLICHQDPSILMKIDGRVFQLCPRCTGLHLGFIFSFIALSMQARLRIRIAGTPARFVVAVPFAVILAHWFLLRLEVLPPDAHSRLVTGLVCGSAISVLVVAYRRELLYHSPLTTRNIGAVHISVLFALSLSVSLALVSVTDVTPLSAIVLISVLMNGFIAIHTALVLMLSRFSYLINTNHEQ